VSFPFESLGTPSRVVDKPRGRPRAEFHPEEGAAISETSGPARCDVFGGRPNCGNARWSAASLFDASEVVEIDELLGGASYHFLTQSYRRLCSGYGLPGIHGPVDCIGNCHTGHGYCYATSNGQCGQCYFSRTCSSACETEFQRCRLSSSCAQCQTLLRNHSSSFAQVCAEGCEPTPFMQCDALGTGAPGSPPPPCTATCETYFLDCVTNVGSGDVCKSSLASGWSDFARHCDPTCAPTAAMEAVSSGSAGDAGCSKACERAQDITLAIAASPTVRVPGELVLVPTMPTLGGGKTACSSDCERAFLDCLIHGPGCEMCTILLALRSGQLAGVCAPRCEPTIAMGCTPSSGITLCRDHGSPQGGPVPWEPSTWAAGQCPASSMTGVLPPRAESSCDPMEHSGASIELLIGTTSLHVAYLQPASPTERSTSSSSNQGMRFSSSLCIDASTNPMRLSADGAALSAQNFLATQQSASCPPPPPSDGCADELVIFSSRAMPSRQRELAGSCATLRAAWRNSVADAPVAAPHCDRVLDAAPSTNSTVGLSMALCDGRAAATAAFNPAHSAHVLRVLYSFEQSTASTASGTSLLMNATNADLTCVLIDGVEQGVTGSGVHARILDAASSAGAHTVEIFASGRSSADGLPTIDLQQIGAPGTCAA